MKKAIASYLVITLLLLDCTTVRLSKDKKRFQLEPGQKPGIDLIIKKVDENQVVGELIAVKENLLLLKDEETRADLSVNINEIDFIKIVKDSRLLAGLGLGLLVGTGIVAVAFSGSEHIYTGLLIWSLSILLGGFWGIESGCDETIKIEGRPDSEIKQILEDLCKKARVQDFQ